MAACAPAVAVGHGVVGGLSGSWEGCPLTAGWDLWPSGVGGGVLWGWGRHGAALIGWGWGRGEEEKGWGAGLFVTAGCWWLLSGLRLWFFACLGTFLLCAGAVVGGRRAPRVPLRALNSARLAPAPRGKKVSRFCVCRPINKKYTRHRKKGIEQSSPFVGWAGAGGVSPCAGPKGRPPPAPARRGCWW